MLFIALITNDVMILMAIVNSVIYCSLITNDVMIDFGLGTHSVGLLAFLHSRHFRERFATPNRSETDATLFATPDRPETDATFANDLRRQTDQRQTQLTRD